MVLDTSAHLSLKVGATAGGDEKLAGVKDWIAMVANRWIVLGVSTYAFKLFFWFWFLSVVPLSQAILVACFDIFLIALGGRLLFKEDISLIRAVAISFVAAGVALVGWA